RALAIYKYGQVITFGGWKDDFMLVVNLESSSRPHGNGKTEHHIFGLSKPKIMEATMLMSSYINSRHQRKAFKNATPSQGDSTANVADCPLKQRSSECISGGVGLKPKFTLSMEV
uniref:Uncharacterized protein n=1 Tax=Capitella teleta TaxID=283909 RepID=X2AIS3_CAPTE